MLHKLATILIFMGFPTALLSETLYEMWRREYRFSWSLLWMVPAGLMMMPFLVFGVALAYWTRNEEF